MKKLITALILCVSMIVSVSTTAYAAEIEYTVHYAQAQKKPVVTIDPDNFSVSFSDTEK